MIVAFLLPEWSVPSQDPIRLMSCESLERTEPPLGNHVRCDQQMDMIRHRHEGMQVVTMKPSFAITYGIDHQLCDLMLA